MIVDDLRAFPIRAFLRIKLQSRTPAVLLPGKVSGNTSKKGAKETKYL
jgi:hypothetical protein